MLERLKKLIHSNRGDLNAVGVFQAIHDLTPEQRDELGKAIGNLTPADVKELESGKHPSEMAAAAPGGAVAALLALLSGFITDPSKLTNILAMITTVIAFFKNLNPPTPAHAVNEAPAGAPTDTEPAAPHSEAPPPGHHDAPPAAHHDAPPAAPPDKP